MCTLGNIGTLIPGDYANEHQNCKDWCSSNTVCDAFVIGSSNTQCNFKGANCRENMQDFTDWGLTDTFIKGTTGYKERDFSLFGASLGQVCTCTCVSRNVETVSAHLFLLLDQDHNLFLWSVCWSLVSAPPCVCVCAYVYVCSLVTHHISMHLPFVSQPSIALEQTFAGVQVNLVVFLEVGTTLFLWPPNLRLFLCWRWLSIPNIWFWRFQWTSSQCQSHVFFQQNLTSSQKCPRWLHEDLWVLFFVPLR